MHKLAECFSPVCQCNTRWSFGTVLQFFRADTNAADEVVPPNELLNNSEKIFLGFVVA